MFSATTQEQDSRLFRLIVLLILILIFIGVATRKIWELRIAAERVGVMHTVGALQSALGIHLSKIVVRDGVGGIATLHQTNPITLLQGAADEAGEAPFGVASGIAPANYRGEFITSEAPQEEGIWYFDLDQRTLVYRVTFAEHFHSSNPALPDQLRYQLVVRYTDLNANGRLDSREEPAEGIAIEPLDAYTWLHESAP